MRLNSNTGCYVTLMGILKEVPKLSMNDQGTLVTMLTILAHNSHPQETIGHYNVVVYGDVALHIRRCGFPNVCLLIEGELQSQECLQYIIAKKVTFLAGSEPGALKANEVCALTPEKPPLNNFHFSKPQIKSKDFKRLH